MNRRFFQVVLFALVCLTVAFLGSCKFTAEKVALDNVQATHDVIARKYMKYVRADAAAQVAAKKMTDAEAAAFIDDEQKLIDSDQRNIAALRKSAGY